MKRGLLFLTIIISSSLKAQEKLSYQKEGETIEFEVSKDQYFVKFNKEYRETIQRNVVELIMAL